MVVMQQDYVRLNQLKRHPRGVLRSLKVGIRATWAGLTGKNLVINVGHTSVASTLAKIFDPQSNWAVAVGAAAAS